MDKLQRSVYVLLFLILSLAGLYVGSEFLIPVALSAIFSMLFIRLCNWFESKKISRGVSSLLCILIFASSIALTLFMLSWQLSGMMENMGAMKQRMTSMVNDLKGWVDDSMGVSKKTQEKIINQQTESGAGAGSMAAGFASTVLDILINTVLVIVYMYLFLFYRTHIKKFILKLVPKGEKSDAEDVVHKSGKVAQQYLSGLGAMIAILWIMYGIGFSLVGVESAIFFAVLCGLLEIIPFVGNLTGTSITVLAVMAQGGNTKMILYVVGIYFVVQFVQTYILEPLIVGEQVNINPLFTIMAIVFGELIWGIPGMILAIPLLGIIKIVCDNVPDLQPYGFLIGTENEKRKKTGIIDKIKSYI